MNKSDSPPLDATKRFGRTADFGKTAAEYRAHRAGFPKRFFDTLAADLKIVPGQRVLDVGTGTGTVARGLAKLGTHVTALDPAEALLAEARTLDGDAGVSIDYHVGRAEHLPFEEESFALVTAGQCWHWFDRAAAAAEIRRVLQPGGHIVIAHFDWLPIPGNVVAATEELILSANPGWTLAGGKGIYPDWLTDLAEAGFSSLTTRSFDVDVEYSHVAWRGRIQASAPIKASLPPERAQAFDQQLAGMLARQFPSDPLAIPHRVWWVTAQK